MPTPITNTKQTFGRVLYDNLARQSGATYAYSGTDVFGKTYENSYDWRDFSIFQVVAAETPTFDITLPSGGTLDSWCGFIAEYASAGASIVLSYESSPAVFTVIDTYNITQNEPSMWYRTFTEVTIGAGLKLRYTINNGATAMDIRQLAAGSELIFPIGQNRGVTPPTLLQGVVTENVISVNGSIIGRNVKREERTARIDLEYLEPDWVRDNWEPFANHAKRFPFFYAWNLAEYPEEIAFSAADSIRPPANGGPPPLMTAGMPLSCITKDSTNA